MISGEFWNLWVVSEPFNDYLSEATCPNSEVPLTIVVTQLIYICIYLFIIELAFTLNETDPRSMTPHGKCRVDLGT